jgi:hypothetical protein
MVLSVGFQGRVHHYRLLFSEAVSTYKIEGHSDEFTSLPDLLQHASETGKLVTALAYPIVDDAYVPSAFTSAPFFNAAPISHSVPMVRCTTLGSYWRGHS